MPGTGFTATSKMDVFPTPQELATWLQAVTVIQTYIFNFKIKKSVAMRWEGWKGASTGEPQVGCSRQGKEP